MNVSRLLSVTLTGTLSASMTLAAGAAGAFEIATFETSFETGEGVGTIIEQGSGGSLSQIFTYEENDIFFSAVPFTVPGESTSHFHLFDFVAPPETNIDLLMGSDAGGLTMTFGNEMPVEAFSLASMDIREIRAGGNVVFEGFRNGGSTGTISFEAGTAPGLTSFQPGVFGNVDLVGVYYEGVGLGGEAPTGSGIVLDNVTVGEAVPEPTAMLGLAIAGIGAGVARRKMKRDLA